MLVIQVILDFLANLIAESAILWNFVGAIMAAVVGAGFYILFQYIYDYKKEKQESKKYQFNV